MNAEDSAELEKLRRDKIRAERKDKFKEVAQLCNVIGEVLARNGLYQDAISEHETELKLSEALEDRLGAGIACRKMGECYSEIGDFKQALRHQNRYLETAKSCENLLEEQRAWATLGRTYLLQSEVTKEKLASNKASQSAEQAFIHSLEVLERLKTTINVTEYMQMKARLLLNLGLVYDGRGDLKKSAEFIKQAIDKTQKYKLYEDLYRCQFSLACMYQRLGNMSNAVRQLEEAHNSAKRLKDKQLETDALSQKALFFSKVGDHSSARRCLKQANKLGAATADQKLQIQKLYTAVVRLEEISDDLSTIAPDDLAERARLYEKLGDLASKIENHKQAIDFYLQQLSCGEELKWPAAELSKVYVSLAQTYCDDKQYDLAIKFYRKELECRHGDNKEMCRTMLNIADAEEQSGKGYDQIIRSYVAAYDYARLAKQPKLQVQALRSMVVLQKAANKASHVTQTEKKLSGIQKKYGLSLDDEGGAEEEEEDSQGSGRDEEEDVPISDLSESDMSDEETGAVQMAGQPARGVGRRFSALTSKRNEKGETPLHRACIEGNLRKVKKLCEQGHPVNPRDFCGWIPLHEAANHDFPDVVEYLLSQGAWLNDRGGDQCGGVTPLHDAANCGNLQVMRILIEHGANCLAKDDEGLTALECMRSWRERAAETLSDEDKQLSVSMERMLLNRMGLREKSNNRIRHSSRSRSPQNSLRQTTLPDSSPVITARQRRNQQRSMSTDEEDELPTITASRRQKQHRSPQIQGSNVKAGDSESDEEIYPSTPAIDKQKSATDSYRNAIAAVGSSAVRPANILTNQGSSDSKPSKLTNQKSALMDEGEIVGDDWLVEDMRPISSKRKRPEVEKLMTTALRETTDSDHSSKRQRRSNESVSFFSDVENIEPSVEEYTIEDFDDPPFDTLDREKSKTLPEISRENEVTHQRNSACSRPELVIPAQSSQRSNRMSKRRRPRQLKLTSILSRNAEAASGSDNDSIPDTSVDPSIPQPSATDVRSVTNPAGLAFGHVTPSVQTAMKVKVRVKEKLLLIPVLMSDTERPISWLAQEASRRYYSLYGVKPLVQLSTKDGALLSPDDLISLVLTSGEELLADVESWDLPPLQTRYAQACQSCHTVTYRNIQTLLQQCQQTGTLSLAGLALRPSQLQPIIRSLQCQYNLKELHLQENRIDDTSLRSLSQVLDTLPNLSLLDLSANQITAVGLNHLSEAVEKSADNPTGKQSKALQVLTWLRLDHNPLGDGCVQGLLSLVGQLPLLERLGLASCSLSQNMFQHHRPLLAEVLKESSLRTLDVSYNRLGSVGVELLLRCLNPGRVAGLALRATVSTWTANHISKHLEQYTAKGCALEELDLSDCHFTGEDSFSLLCVLEHAKSLRRLKMNNNPKIDNSFLTEFLKKSFQFDTVLEELEIVGCGIISPLTSDFLDILNDKLNGSYSLNSLLFSCQKLDKIDIDSLKQIWTDRWQGDALCHFQEDLVQLSVKNVTQSR